MSLKLKSVRTARCIRTPLLSKAVGILIALFSLGLVLSSTGCIMSSISESSDSSSDSSKQSSKSSKSSSSESKESYLRDVKQYTASFTRSNGDIRNLPKGLTKISEKHGVTDWEAYSVTYLGIGEGFAKAAVTKEQVDVFSSILAHGDQLKVAAIQQGFSQGQ